MNALTIRDLSVVAGEPRVQDIVLGERLGLERPRFIREIINRNRPELGRYGGLPQFAANPPKGSKGGRPSRAFMLNEMQALLLCMFSNTDRAADVRQQLIEVFMAWRSGELRAAPPPAPPAFQPAYHNEITALVARTAQLVALIEAQAAMRGPQGAESISHAMMMAKPGLAKRLAKLEHDPDVLEMVVQLHRRQTINQALAIIRSKVGPARAPSRTAIARYWKQLDAAFGGRC